MTLNITVATPRCIYQSADYRLLDWTTGQLTDFDTQKIVLTNNFRWTATVDEKPLNWVGSSKRDFLSFPATVKGDLGNASHRVVLAPAV